MGRLVDLVPVQADGADEVDLNLVTTGQGRLIEVQGTGEGGTFDRAELDRMLDLGQRGIAELTRIQAKAIGG